jgi:hypothetical protein
VSEDQVIRTFAALRIAVGAGAWLAPRLSARLLGMEEENSPQAAYLMRLFGVRDAALGVGLMASAKGQRPSWLRTAIGCDLADGAASLLATRRGELTGHAGAAATGAGLAGAALGAVILQRETR